MKSIYPPEPAAAVSPIALKPAVAARLLGLSEKTLWSNTVPRGDIPAVKVGTRTLYFRHQLEAWADEQLAHQQAVSEQAGEEKEAEVHSGSTSPMALPS